MDKELRAVEIERVRIPRSGRRRGITRMPEGDDPSAQCHPAGHRSHEIEEHLSRSAGRHAARRMRCESQPAPDPSEDGPSSRSVILRCVYYLMQSPLRCACLAPLFADGPIVQKKAAPWPQKYRKSQPHSSIRLSDSTLIVMNADAIYFDHLATLELLSHSTQHRITD